MEVTEKKIHFIGIGGIGMSAIAQIALKRGAVVTGSDLTRNAQIDSLEKRGAKIFLGHSEAHLTDGTVLVVHSSAIPRNNPEMLEAAKKEIEVISRSAMLARLMDEKKSITVTGSHGKTTTTWLASHLLIEAGFDPTVMVGGIVKSMKSNFKIGTSEWFVTEVDESDKLLLEIKPFYSLITNIDREHLDIYKNLDDIKKVFTQYIRQTARGGTLIACADDANLKDVLVSASERVVTYGFGKDASLRGLNIELNPTNSRFDIEYDGHFYKGFAIEMLGRHNVLNALGVAALAFTMGIDAETARRALASCQRVARRFDIKWTINDITLVDDYGHHPREVAATIAAAKKFAPGRLIVVFQPHRFSRTKYLYKDFAKSLMAADFTILTSVYAANEEAIEGVSTQLIFDEMKKLGCTNPEYIPKLGQVADYLIYFADRGDTILTLGAGDVGKLGDEIPARL